MISGVHSQDRLLVRDLQFNSFIPVLTRYLSPEEQQAMHDTLFSDPDSEGDLFYDTSDEESDVEDDNNEDSEDIEVFVDGLDVAEFARLELEGDAIKENADILEHRLLCLAAALQDIKKYPSSHAHLREIPNLKGNLYTLNRAERRNLVNNARILPTTFGRKRRGNTFM